MSASLVAQDIDHLVSTRADAQEVRRSLSSWDVRALLEDLRQRIAVDRRLSTEASAMSYRHPNGFTKLQLMNSPGIWALRLHMWHEAPAVDDNDVHDHCGPFASRVLLGSLNDEVFMTRNDSTAHTHEELRDELQDGLHRLTPVGHSLLTLSASRVYSTGDTYWMQPDILHRTAPQAPFPAITLVVEWPRSKSASRIFRAHRRPQHEVVPTAGSTALVQETIEEVLGNVV